VLLGFAYPQGVASAFGPQALAPRPGDTILDMCAAPGGKTILLDAIAGDGPDPFQVNVSAAGRFDAGDAGGAGGAGAAPPAHVLLAGEYNTGRAGILVQSLARCGVAGALVVQQDAQAFPVAARFDRILLDAPCTGEGTFRVPSPRYDLHGRPGLARVTPLQRRLLARGLDVLAPGGRLLYSTCAYAPEENEAVLDAVLGTRDDVRILPLPASTPGLPGLASWDGAAYRADTRHARRLLPHHTGSWGFFVALLEKDAASVRVARDRRGPDPTLADDPAARELCTGYFETYFGVRPAELEPLLVVARGRDCFILPRAAAGVDVARLRVVAPGLRFLHRTGARHVATNAALRWLGPRVRSNVVDLDYDRAVEMCLAGSVAAPGERDRPVAAIRVDGVVAGKGAIRAGRVSLDIPAGWR
jgi:16S rRNA C967 or C1407 C5-methylase (RsmB/RsmF family)